MTWRLLGRKGTGLKTYHYVSSSRCSGTILRRAFFLLGAIALLSGFSSCSRTRKSILAITHVTVIDATGAAPKPDMTVVITGQRITAVAPSNSIEISGGAQILDATEKFLIPGLADMHVHLTGAGEPTGSRKFIIPLLVVNGVTTVRDMGGKVEELLQLRKEIESGELLGPRIFFAGPYLDGDPPGYQPSIVVKSARDARAAVDHLASENVNFIKTQSHLGREAFFAIAEQAHKRGIRFVGHVPDAVSAREASIAGQASIEHLTGVLLACSTKEDQLRAAQFAPDPPNTSPAQSLGRSRAWQRALLDSYDSAKAAALFRTFAVDGTWQVPTFPIFVHLGFLTPRNSLLDDPRMTYVPSNVRKIWKQGVQERLKYRAESDFALREEIIKRSFELAGKMNAADVRFMAGTDLAAPNVFPGWGLHEDLAFLVEAGLTPMQALQAATKNPAEFLGKLGTQGTIERSKTADLVLLDANPLANIHNSQKIRAVIVRGKLLDSGSLANILSSVGKFAAAD